MNKSFFFFLIAFASLIFYSCEPAHKDGGEGAPAHFNEGIEAQPSDGDHTSVAVTDSAMIDTTKK